MVALAPYAIFVGIAGAIGLAVFATWHRLLKLLAPITDTYTIGLQQAGIAVRSQDLVLGMISGATVAWIAYMLVEKPNPLTSVIALPVAFLLAFGACRVVVRTMIKRRVAAFTNQLEMVLRLISSGLRAGLSIRQAMMIVIEQSPDPTHTEFMRVVGQTNIGMSVYDALDALAVRMPSKEMTMMARVVRMQSQTGGNLSKILETLASTIKDRRRLQRKMKAITAEGRASGFIIAALPVVVGGFILVSNADMRSGMFDTTIGHIALGLAIGLEGSGILILNQIVKVDV